MPDRDLYALALKLIANGVFFRYRKLTGRPARLTAVSFEVTQKCIARCVMCNIWQPSRQVSDLPIENWTDLLTSPIFSDLVELDITGGEPFLRDDIVKLVGSLPGLKHVHLKKMKSVAVTTNGLLTRRILEYVPQMVERLSQCGMELIVVCAMDAVGEIHDRIRNVKDAWIKVDETIRGLNAIRQSNKNLIIGLKTTILPQSVDELDNISRYAEEKGLFTIISPCIITGNRYQNTDLEKDLAFQQGDREKMIRYFTSGSFRWNYHSKRLVDYLKTGRMDKPCSAGFNYLFIRSNGDVYPCPLVKLKVGNFREEGIERLFYSKEASGFRKQVNKYPECRICTEPGLERYALPCEGFSYLGLMAAMGRKNFSEFHKHMGLDKYFTQKT